MIDPPGSVNAGGDVNVTDATVISSGQLDSQGSLNLNPGASLVVDPPGSVNTGGDVNLNDSTAIVQGDLDVGGSINIGPGSGFVMDPTGMVNADDSVQVADDAALIVDGELTTPTTSISDGGGLAGTGVINGNVNNSGVVVPGDPISNSTGTLTINGNYTQNQNGTLQINANSTEDFSKVVVNGDATIGGTLAVVPLNGFKPQFGQQLPSFLQANDVDGEFSNIEMPPGFRGRVEEDDGDLTLTFAPASYTQVAQNQNQANVAAALDGFIPATSGDRLVVSTALDHLSTSEYPDAFDAILPAFYQTVSSIGLSLVNTQSQLIDQRLDAIRLGVDRGFSVQGLGKNVPIYKETDGKSAVDGKSGVDGKKSVVTPTLEDTHWGVWVMGSGIFGRSYSVENLPNYRYSSGQFLVGADHRWNKYFSTGLFAGYQGAYATYPESGRVWMNGATFGVYATFDARNGFYASTIVSGSYSNYSTRRSIEFGTIDRTARGDLYSGSVGTFLNVEYDFKAGGFTFGPVVSGQYTYLGVAPFTESGADSLNLRVGQQNLNSLQLNVGGRLAYTWSLADGNILLIPQVRMFWNHEFLQNSTSISSSLDGGAGPGFNYRTISPSRDSVFAGAGLIAQLGRNWNASVYYNTDFGSATSNTHIVSASAGFLW